MVTMKNTQDKHHAATDRSFSIGFVSQHVSNRTSSNARWRCVVAVFRSQPRKRDDDGEERRNRCTQYDDRCRDADQEMMRSSKCIASSIRAISYQHTSIAYTVLRYSRASL